MKFFGDSIKAKVVAGFGLALGMVIIAIYLTYSSFTQLLNSVDELSRPNQKLTRLHHTLATISTAESSIRAYTLTNQNQHFKSYLNQLDTIKSQLDTLRSEMQGSPPELAQLDSITIMIGEKQQIMQRFVALKKEQQNQDLSGKAMRQIASTAQEKPLSTVIKQHTTTTISDRLSLNEKPTEEEQDQPQENPKEEKKGFFGRLFSKKEKENKKAEAPPQVIVPEINVTREVKVDTNNAATPVAPLSKVRRILSNVQREADAKQKQLQAEELSLLHQDKQVMDQIRTMMYELEQHEQEQSRVNSVRARKQAKETSTVLLLIGIVGLGSGIAFILLILRDITRSNKYKSSLIRAQKQSVQLARAKEAFVANMSHEMRTPLNVILGFTQQLRHSVLKPQQQEHVQAINSAGEHLLHVVNDVLDLSKIEAGKLSITSAPFSLQQLVTELEQTFKLKAASKEIDFSCHVSDNMPDALQGDLLRIKQVLFNLIDNAIKFTHEGRVKVYFTLKSQRRGRVTTAILVSDTGIGIPKERLQHVFGEFNQADDSILRKYGGTGLGLSISKKLAEMQGGTLTAESEPGQGTTFTMVLPLLLARQVIQAPARAAHLSEHFSGLKALVIDDDVYSRMLAELILSRWGMQVYLANDGQEAIELVQKYEFDVVLTDLQLPGANGKTISREIRKYAKEVPILALSANMLSNDPDFFKGSAITGHLLKPYTEQELHQLLAQVLPGSAEMETPTPPPHTLEEDTPAALYCLDEMRQFTGADYQMLATVLEVLLTDQQQNLSQLQEEAKAADWDKAGNTAHKMLTAFKHLKAEAAIEPLSTLEQVLHQPELKETDLTETANQAAVAVEQVLEALTLELAQLKSMAESTVD